MRATWKKASPPQDLPTLPSQAKGPCSPVREIDNIHEAIAHQIKRSNMASEPTYTRKIANGPADSSLSARRLCQHHESIVQGVESVALMPYHVRSHHTQNSNTTPDCPSRRAEG